MPRTCTICSHPDRKAIDAALVGREAYRHIAGRFGTSTGALQRHKSEHLPASLVRAREAEEVTQADNLLDQVRSLQKKTLGILDRAEAAGDLRTALAGVREARGCLELLAKLSGELDERAQVNILVAPEWIALRGNILTALETYPEARRAVAEALNGRPE